jgi:hypothetical protein
MNTSRRNSNSSHKQALRLIRENTNILNENLKLLKNIAHENTIAGHIKAKGPKKATRKIMKPCKSKGYGMGRRGKC